MCPTHICQYLVLAVKGLIEMWNSAHSNQARWLLSINKEKCLVFHKICKTAPALQHIPIYVQTTKHSSPVAGKNRTISNDVFVNIGPTLDKAKPNVIKIATEYLGDMIKEIMFLAPLDRSEFKNIIVVSNKHCSRSRYRCPIAFTLSNEYIAVPLIHICSFSFSECVFSDQLKVANEYYALTITLQWRHNERDGVSNHRRLDCLLYSFFRRRSKSTSTTRHWPWWVFTGDPHLLLFFSISPSLSFSSPLSFCDT